MNEESKPKRVAKAKDIDARVSMPVRLSATTHAALMAEAEARMVHASLIVERAVIKFLAELKPVDEQLSIGE